MRPAACYVAVATSWAEFLPTVRVGGALPVTFNLDGDHVVVEVVVPYVPPVARDNPDPNKIPIAIAEGFPVPLTMRYKLPDYSPRQRCALHPAPRARDLPPRDRRAAPGRRQSPLRSQPLTRDKIQC